MLAAAAVLLVIACVLNNSQAQCTFPVHIYPEIEKIDVKHKAVMIPVRLDTVPAVFTLEVDDMLSLKVEINEETTLLRIEKNPDALVDPFCVQYGLDQSTCIVLQRRVNFLQHWLTIIGANDCKSKNYLHYMHYLRLRICLRIKATVRKGETRMVCQMLRNSTRLLFTLDMEADQSIVPIESISYQVFAHIEDITSISEKAIGHSTFDYPPGNQTVQIISPKNGEIVAEYFTFIAHIYPPDDHYLDDFYLCIAVDGHMLQKVTLSRYINLPLRILTPGRHEVSVWTDAFRSGNNRATVSIEMRQFTKGLGDDFVLVTAADEAYVQNNRLENLIGSIHFWEPEMRIEIYDLGISVETRARIKDWKNVIVRSFPFEELPPHFRRLRETYAFKPWALHDVLQREDRVVWIDANMEIRRPLSELRMILTTKGHFFTIQRPRFPNARFHFPGAVAQLGCSAEAYSRYQSPAGFQGYKKGSYAYENVLLPLVDCALDEKCIAPSGTSRSNHRQDQTAFNAILCRLNWTDVEIDIKWWLSSHIDDQNEKLQPTVDPTDWNDLVVYTRRENPVKPYLRFLRPVR